MSTYNLEQDIINSFKDLQVESLDNSLLKKCILLCKELSLSPEELTEEWEAFSFNEKLTVNEPTVKDLDKFEIFKLKQKQFTKYKAPTIVGIKRKSCYSEEEEEKEEINENLNLINSSIKSSLPPKRKQKIITKTDNAALEFAKIAKEMSGKIIASFNENLEISQQKHDNIPIISFPYNEQSIDNTITERYMYDSLKERSSKFETIADKLRNRLEYELIAENAIKADPFDQNVTLLCTDRLEPFHLFLQSPIISTARIGKEKLSQDGTEKLFLESTHAGVPIRTEINIDRLLTYSVFPGQVVAIKGSNPTSKLFRLNAIRAPSLLPSFPCTKINTPLSIITACGPFATNQMSVNLEPLQFLLNQVKERKPDILLLNGPFVDQRQSLSNGGVIQHHGTDYTADQWFRVQIDMIMENIRDLKTQVYIFPSQNDIHHPYFVYPQPRYNITHSELGKKLFFLDDPCTLSIDNSLTIGTTSTDILAHLSNEEVVKRPKGISNYDRISVLLHHILQQGCYYPLYPPAEGVCIDSSLIHKMQMKKYAPNILITPSDFLPFVKRIGDTICINPGRVSKGTSGTFSEIIINPFDNNTFFDNTKIIVCGV